MMVKKHCRLAGLDVTVGIPEAVVYEEERHLTKFRTEPGQAPHGPGEGKSRIGVKTLRESMEVENLIARNNGFIFRGSYIHREGWPSWQSMKSQLRRLPRMWQNF